MCLCMHKTGKRCLSVPTDHVQILLTWFGIPQQSPKRQKLHYGHSTEVSFLYAIKEERQKYQTTWLQKKKKSELVNARSATAVRWFLKLATILPNPVRKGQKYHCNVIGLVTKYKGWKSIKQLNKNK